ncbi:uncharacterized protein LOC115799068 [Archocentrus centrarchus]|uniref:uncharacterized protein LOC115799068 n=1 Tax=Archocentrus centrarchus TaxID=63155 RepID=UPI0011E9D625|nr:uncharacterized protein LOC115799068 [Archocentrus centrarchus]XP_030611874.1 uncharacterized protein LOC115799068 [Archocentrus centrarchus]XP_030611875.1 uncharacterized protein LOC115799068 [Archocentrus centrarchus]
MKHRHKTKNTFKEKAESQEDEEELLKDRQEPSDPKSQEDPKEEYMVVAEEEGDTNDTPERRNIRLRLRRIPKYRKYQRSEKLGVMPPLPMTPLSSITEHTPPSSAVAPPFVHHSFQETSPQFNLEKPSSVTKEQGIKPSSLCDSLYDLVDSASSAFHSSASGSQLISGTRQFESLAEHEPLSDVDVNKLDHQDQPSFNCATCFGSYVFQDQQSKQTDQRSIMLKPTEISDLLPVSPYRVQVRYQSNSASFSSRGPTFSSGRGSSPPQPEDVNACELLRKRSTSLLDLLPTWSNEHVHVGQPEGSFLRTLPQSMFSYQPGFSPPLNSEVSQTKEEQSSDSSAETNERSEQLDYYMPEVTEVLHFPASEPKTVYYGRRSHSNPLIPIPDPCPQSSVPPLVYSPECSDEEKLEEEAAGGFLWGAECSPAADNIDGAAASPVRAEYVSATNTLPPSSHLQVSSSCCLTRSHSAPSLSKIPKNNFRRAASLPDMKLKEFTPAISADDCDDETYSFQCSCPGLYQCSVSSLVFNMKGEGGVAYRTVPWNRRLLAQHHKKPAGPLFDIKCLQQSVCQLHLPHCEIISTGGGRSLQVAHVSDEGIEFISPHQVTETHVVVNISGFSAYGNVKDEDSPPDPVQALVLLFYKPPEDPDLRSVLSVLLLPRNIVFHKIQRDRRKLDKNERYLETSPHCKLHPKQVYALSTSPEDDLIKVQPKEAEFDDEYHESYFPSFQVVLKRILTDVNLTLRDSSSSSCVWEREVCLLPSGVKTLETGPKKRPSDLRSCFIRRISGPVLSSLLDQLLEKRVITDAEREAADTKQSRSDRARFVFDTVSNKGEAASSEMMEFLCEEDPFLCEHLGLKQNGEKAS